MNHTDPPAWTIEIIPPGGQAIRPDRRRDAAVFRPYSPLDGRVAGDVSIVTDRRRRRRAAAAGHTRGRRIDLQS